MRRIVLAAFGVGVALAAVAHCGGTTGSDSPSPTPVGETDATVLGAAADTLDAGPIYTNTFDVYIQYADQDLPEVQAPPEAGGDAGSPFPDCPPFVYVDSTGQPVPPGTCDPASGSECINADGARSADWSGDGGEVLAVDGGVCATYPWLGSLAGDVCLTGDPSFVGGAFDELPPCNWARGTGTATHGSKIGHQRYDLCMDLYGCFMQSRCFIDPNPNPHGTYLNANPLEPCLCEKPGEALSAAQCVNEKGPCYDYEAAALEAPIDPNNASTTASYVLAHWATETAGEPGTAGAFLNEMFIDALATRCFPLCALDAGFDCGPLP